MNASAVQTRFPGLARFFQDTSEEVQFKATRFNKDDVLVKRDEMIDHVIVMSNRDCMFYNENISGQTIYVFNDEIAIIGGAELVGDSDRYISSVAARRDCEGLILSSDDFWAWYESTPAISRVLAVRFAKIRVSLVQ